MKNHEKNKMYSATTCSTDVGFKKIPLRIITQKHNKKLEKKICNTVPQDGAICYMPRVKSYKLVNIGTCLYCIRPH